MGIRLVDVTLFKPAGEGAVAIQTTVPRADLTDRNGELLARDLPVKDLYARPDALPDLEDAAQSLAATTGADARRLMAGFRLKLHSKRPYVLVARHITPDQEAAVMHLGLPGLEFEPSARRYYPDGRNAAQLLGVTDPDNNGVSGLELGLQDKSTNPQAGRSPPPSTCGCNTS